MFVYLFTYSRILASPLKMEPHINPYMQCPYNEAHSVPKLRMQYHLVKCRKRNEALAKIMKACPFNATHIMPEPELQWHLQFCENRSLIEAQKYNITPITGELGNPTFVHNIPAEDWDDSDGEFEEQPVTSSEPVRRNAKESEFRPGGALGVSIAEDDVYVPPSLLGFGRGRVNAILSSMNKNHS